MEKSQIKDTIIARVEDFGVPPDIILRLIAVIQDKTHTIHNVVDIIQSDPSLTARILRVANSAAFCRKTPINTLSRAVIQMGERIVTGIALDFCMKQVYEKNLTGYNCSSEDFWAHSLMTAIAAREISRHTNNNISPDIAYTAGILHDIGKAIISEFIVDNNTLMQDWLDKGEVGDFLAAEKQLVDTDHAEVGWMMASKWKFPEELLNAIRYHHNPNNVEEKFRDIVFCIHLADITAMIAGKGTGIDSFIYDLDSNYVNYIDLGENELSFILLKIQEEFVQIIESIRVVKET
ncbi:HDOD domain-containing protein [bacterium]|nr:HDOD domain-containing protein [bacterium]